MRFLRNCSTRIGARIFVPALLALSALPFSPCQQQQQEQKQPPPVADPAKSPAPSSAAPAVAVPAVAQPGPGNEDAQLLKLAIELKAEVDKSNKDTLSLAVIRKADEIARVAHEIKDKLKVSAGAGPKTESGPAAN